MKKIDVFFIVCGLYLLMLTGRLTADLLYINDGEDHLINNSTYAFDEVWLDYQVPNDPGTRFHIVNGGVIANLIAFNNSTIVMEGGIIKSLLGIFNNCIITGGSIGDYLETHGSGITSVSGGNMPDTIWTEDNSTIYLHGSSFSVDGQILNSGESLRDYAALSSYYGNMLTGTINGVLEDGSMLNSAFYIQINTAADIIVIPEPGSAVLLGLGVLLIRKRRKSARR